VQGSLRGRGSRCRWSSSRATFASLPDWGTASVRAGESERRCWGSRTTVRSRQTAWKPHERGLRTRGGVSRLTAKSRCDDVSGFAGVKRPKGS
jgi:hypothetical protein